METKGKSRQRQHAAQRTSVNILRYIMDHPSATRRTVAEDLALSFPNICRIIAGFQDNDTVIVDELKQMGKRGPRSRTLSLRNKIGCTIGIDLEATHLRAVALDYANQVVAVLREPVPYAASAEDLVGLVAGMAKTMVGLAKNEALEVHAVGLGLPGPVIDESTGRAHTEIQTGLCEIEFVPAAEKASGLPTFSAANTLCFAVGHHRFRHPRRQDTDMVVLNRFGLGICVMRREEKFSGELGLLPFGQGAAASHYRDVCTGASLLRFARARGDYRDLHVIVSSPDDQLVAEWLIAATPAFAQAVYCGIVMFAPGRVVIEGIFSNLPEHVRASIIRIVTDELETVGLAVPSIGLFEGDDLMGARGAALVARDHVVDDVLTQLVHATRA